MLEHGSNGVATTLLLEAVVTAAAALPTSSVRGVGAAIRGSLVRRLRIKRAAVRPTFLRSRTPRAGMAGAARD
eukprot:7093756-Alexandrium_andersonii.AAC.1